MATTALTVPAGTTTVYASEDAYVDTDGNPTTDVAVSGTYTVDNGASVAPDSTGLSATITLTGQPGVTKIAWSGLDAAGNPITSAGEVTVDAPAVKPAVTATMVLTTTAPAAAPTPAPVPSAGTFATN